MSLMMMFIALIAVQLFVGVVLTALHRKFVRERQQLGAVAIMPKNREKLTEILWADVRLGTVTLAAIGSWTLLALFVLTVIYGIKTGQIWR